MDASRPSDRASTPPPDLASPALPPGSLGLPMVGETLAFLRNPFAFLEQRRARHGDVWKSSVVGRKIVFLAGLQGAECFYAAGNISRADAHPFPLVDLFGGVNMEMYDGPRHQSLKAMALTAFDRAAIAGYLPGLQGLIESKLAHLAAAGEFSATAELRKLAIEAICQSVMGFSPGSETDAICRDYALVLNGLVSLPVAVPGTPYARARAARDRLLVVIRRVVAEKRANPQTGGDALSRMLQARAADGRVYSDDEAVLEVHHIFIAGFIVYALLAEMMRQLVATPELRARCAAEIQEHVPSGAALTMEALAKLRLSRQVVLEAKRYVPLVPLAFGRAARTFTCGGHLVPEGWTVYLALSLNNRDPAVFADPDRFDPDRFGPGRAEHERHPLAFIPQGAEPATGHRCLGLDYSTFLSLSFLTLAVRDYEWDLPPQNMDYRWTTIPPEPKDGLRIRMRRRA